MARPANPDTPKKFVITLNAEGTAIDWSGFRDTTKDRFVSLVKGSDEVLAALDRPSEARSGDANSSDSASEKFTETGVATIIDAVGMVNSVVLRMGVAKFVKHPFFKDAETGKPFPLVIDPDLAAKAFTLNSHQHSELDPLLQKKLNSLKLPDFLAKNMDWYMLGMMYVKFCSENVKDAMQNQINRDFQKATAAAAGIHAATAKNPKPDSDAVRVSNASHMNGHATQTPEEFPITEQETFPSASEMPQA